MCASFSYKRQIKLFRLWETPVITPVKVAWNHMFCEVSLNSLCVLKTLHSSPRFILLLWLPEVIHLWWVIQRDVAIVGGCVCVCYLSVINDVEYCRGDYAADGIGQHEDHHILPSPQRDLNITDTQNTYYGIDMVLYIKYTFFYYHIHVILKNIMVPCSKSMVILFC